MATPLCRAGLQIGVIAMCVTPVSVVVNLQIGPRESASVSWVAFLSDLCALSDLCVSLSFFQLSNWHHFCRLHSSTSHQTRLP
jgi:hypothetical protein